MLEYDKIAALFMDVTPGPPMVLIASMDLTQTESGLVLPEQSAEEEMNRRMGMGVLVLEVGDEVTNVAAGQYALLPFNLPVMWQLKRAGYVATLIDRSLVLGTVDPALTDKITTPTNTKTAEA